MAISTEKELQIYEMLYKENFTQKEISKVLGISASTVSKYHTTYFPNGPAGGMIRKLSLNYGPLKGIKSEPEKASYSENLDFTEKPSAPALSPYTLNGNPLPFGENDVTFSFNGEPSPGMLYVGKDRVMLYNPHIGEPSATTDNVYIKELVVSEDGKVLTAIFKNLTTGTFVPKPSANIEEQLKDALATIEYLDGRVKGADIRVEQAKSDAKAEVENARLKAEIKIKEIKDSTEATIKQNVEQLQKEWVEEQLSKKKKVLSKAKKLTAKIGDNLNGALSICYKTKQPALLMGPPGSGKNTILESVALANGRAIEDVVIISITADMTKDSFLGHYVYDATVGTIWQDGPLAEGLRSGKMIIIDEMNMAHADILAVLNNLTQVRGGELGTITIADNGGQVIKPHPDARLFATANPSTGNAGTKELNQATLSRFLVLDVDYLKEKDEVELLVGKFPDLPIETIERVVGGANKVRDLKYKKEISVDIGTRHLEKTLMLINEGMEQSDSIRYGILNDCQVEADLHRIGGIFNT